MKKCVMILLLCTGFSLVSPAQDIASVIAAGVKKVIRAVDLRIQRLQNKTIGLQNVQKQIENVLSKRRLDEIGEWVERQRQLYAGYYEELARVKSVITYYHRVTEIVHQQKTIIAAYQRAWRLCQQDEQFTPDEIAYMGRVYSGMLEQSVKALDQLFLVITSFATTMSDAARLDIIQAAGERMDQVQRDLLQFNQQNMVLRIQRAKDQQEVDVIRKLYDIN